MRLRRYGAGREPVCSRMEIPMAVVLFLVHTLFCFWVVFRDGAEVIEGWRSFFLIDWFAATLTADQLRFYVGISWIAGLIGLVVLLATGG